MSKPQQPELRRSGRHAGHDDSAKTTLTAQDPNRSGTSGGPIPEDQRPGHHPEQEQDKPTEAFVQRAKERVGRRTEDGRVDKPVLGLVLAIAAVAAVVALIRFRRRRTR
jgi:hypothetical protein